jgi:hypothetical protein
VCCQHNAGTADKRGRGGLKPTEQGWSYHCFNCNYTASFILGRTLSYKARRLLGWLGVPDAEIDILNLESLRHRSVHGILDDRQRMFNVLSGIEFEERELPPMSELLVDSYEHREYLRSRKVPEDYPVMAQLHEERSWKNRPSVIIPFTHNDRIVGYTQRFLDDRKPKYISDSQPGYVFGTDLQHNNWTNAIVVEGIFDALSIYGVALMHDDISSDQSLLLSTLNKQIIVVPDRDKTGLALCDKALELGYSVSLPDWDADVKDVNDAVVKYGKLPTLLSILRSATNSKIKIEMKRKKIVKAGN